MTPTLLIPRPAATLILARDGDQGPEIFMMQRTLTANFVAGAYVFPGGAVDPGDHDACWSECAGLDDSQASRILGLDSGGLAYWVAAVRECFEESGLLFAQDAKQRLVDLDALSPGELAAMRTAAAAGTDALVTLCRERGWQLAVDRLAYFAHWLTPPGMPRRSDVPTR